MLKLTLGKLSAIEVAMGLEQKHGLVERRTSRSSRNASRDFEGSMAKRLGSTTIDELSAESPVRVEGKQVETLVQPMSPH